MKVSTVPITVFFNAYIPFSWHALHVLTKKKGEKKKNKTPNHSTVFKLFSLLNKQF